MKYEFANLEGICLERPQYKEALVVFSWHLQITEDLIEGAGGAIRELKEIKAEEMINKRSPIIELIEFSFDGKIAYKSFNEFAKILTDNASAIKRIIEKLDERRAVEFLAAFMNNDIEAIISWSGLKSGSEELIMFISFLQMVSRVQLLPLSKRYGHLITENNWAEGSCPICGEVPSYMELESIAGRMFLHCPNCFMEYHHPFFKCPLCGDGSKGVITLTKIKGADGFIIYACGNCKGYLKGIDRRESQLEVSFPLTDIITMETDGLAKEMGLNKLSLAVYGV